MRSVEEANSILLEVFEEFPHLVKFAHNRFGRQLNLEQIEDAVSEAFTKMSEHIRSDTIRAISGLPPNDCVKGVPRRQLRVWLIEAIGNFCLRAIAQQSHRTSADTLNAIHSSRPTTSFSDEVVTSLLDAVSELPAEEREIITRLYHQRERVSTIAADMKISTYKVKSTEHRALALLRKHPALYSVFDGETP